MDKTRGLFRGKRTDNGEWVTGYFLADTAPCSLKAQGKCKCKHDGSIAFIFYWNDDCHEYEETEIDPSTLGEYTGLTDKNGKMIFEGDIVTWGNQTYQVIFEQRNGCAYFGMVYEPEETIGFDHYSLGRLEIIGNIHDNPELMGGAGNGD